MRILRHTFATSAEQLYVGTCCGRTGVDEPILRGVNEYSSVLLTTAIFHDSGLAHSWNLVER
jgi:hypothetical protein